MPSPISLQTNPQPTRLDDTPHLNETSRASQAGRRTQSPAAPSPWQETKLTLEALAVQLANGGLEGIPRPLRLAAPMGLQFKTKTWLSLEPTPARPSHLFPLQSHFTALDKDIATMRYTELDKGTNRYYDDHGAHPRFIDEWRFPLEQLHNAESQAKALYEQLSFSKRRKPDVRRPDLIEHFSKGNEWIVRAAYLAKPDFCSHPAPWQHRLTMAEAAAKTLARIHQSGHCHGYPVNYNWLIQRNPLARHTFHCEAIGLSQQPEAATPLHMASDVRAFVWSMLPLDMIQELSEWAIDHLKQYSRERAACKALTQAVECCYELNASTPRQTPTAEELANLTRAVNAVLAFNT